MLPQLQRSAILIATVALALLPGLSPVAASATPASRPDTQTRSDLPFLFGTLLSDPARAAGEAAAGIGIAHLELGWDLYEPEDGIFDPAYVDRMRARLVAFEAAGQKVVLGAGLQYPPGWAYALPNSRYVSQHGTAAGPLNLTFNQTLRDRAARYLDRIHKDFDLNRFWAVRIGAGGNIEALYPPEEAGGHTNSYWAYDEAAQGGAGRPSSIPPAPYPGWRPGEASYGGQPFGPEQVRAWLAWYVGALTDTVNWQLDTYHNLGFIGYQQVLLPGVGTKPIEFGAAVATLLASNPNRTLGRGAAWDQVVAGLRPGRNVMVYVSSMADGSGSDAGCEPGDQYLAPGDSWVFHWSATRWIVYNARRAGLPTMGENPGRSDIASYSPAMLQMALHQMASCHMLGFMWAHSAELYHPAGGVSLTDYAAALRPYRWPSPP